MRIVIVDDELLSLTRLKNMLLTNDIEGIEIVGEYLNPIEAYEAIQTLQPDVVFLDIEMPGLNGLAMSKKIRKILPNTEIVFATGFDQYALDAFDIHVIDYLVKPVQKDRLHKTLMQLHRRLGKEPAEKKNGIFIELFGAIQVVLEDGQVQTMKWRTAKAKELFAYMIYHHDEVIHGDTILDLLWPDSDIIKAKKQLYTTIYTVRQTLKKYGLDMIQISSPLFDSGYKLTIDNVRIDVEEWTHQIKALQPLSVDTIEAHLRVLHAYKGHYLEGHDYIWAEAERERLKRMWLHHGQQISEFYIEHQNYDAAIRIEEKRQSFCRDEEESYFMLMKLYDALNNTFAVEEQYWLLEKLLKEQFAAEPVEEVRNWYKNWKKERAISQVDTLN
ncbi:MAG: response regulator [Lysinibacillus sp.]